MEIPKFSGIGGEIDPTIWFLMVKERRRKPGGISYFLDGEPLKWWTSLDANTRYLSTWEEFEKIFQRRWINDANLKEIQDKLKEANLKN